jgi:hypothetical protein
MIVAIHQPHYLPWLGYLHRMAQADLFVVLDHVQFERRNYQNRTMIRVEGEARWLTVPVIQGSQKERITEKRVDNRADGARSWASNHFATLRHAYRQAGFFNDYAAELRSLYEAKWERLVDLDSATVEFLRDAFGIRTPLARSSELKAEGARGELLLNLCREAGADTLLAGMGGSRGYLDAEQFARAGVRIVLHDFRHPEYPQCGAAPFIRGLSALDMLFNCGPQSRGMLLGEPARRAAELRFEPVASAQA